MIKKKLSKKEKIILGLVSLAVLSVTTSGIYLFNNDSLKYMELLVKTSDTNLLKGNEIAKTLETTKEERAGSSKQGYIIVAEPEGYKWGNLELDPMSFALIKIPISEWNASWLEPEYNYSAPITNEKKVIGYEILTERKYRLPLESFLDKKELNNLKNIPYNDKSYHAPIIKYLTNISEKIVLVDWENRPKDMKLHGSSGMFTICESGCNYSQLSTWEAAQQANLTGTGPCIANISGIWTNVDNGRISVSGWTTTETDYVKIYTEGEARHNGTFSQTAYRVYNDNNVSGPVVTIAEDYVIIDGLQVGTSNITRPGITGINSDVTLADNNLINISNNIVVGHANYAYYQYGINGVRPNGNYYIYNNLIYNLSKASGSTGIRTLNASKAFVYSNTAYGGNYGFRGTNGVTAVVLVLKNNVCKNASGECYHSSYNTTDSTNNLASHDTPPGLNPIWCNVTFFNENASNFHLSSTDTCARGNGTDLSADPYLKFNYDIDRETRTGTWDVGADQYNAGVTDTEYPQFSSYWDNNGTLVDTGTGIFNVTVLNTNGTVLLEINGVNTTASNVSGSATTFNASYSFSSGGVYAYKWYSWGNGTLTNYNVSNIQSYTINSTAVVCNITEVVRSVWVYSGGKFIDGISDDRCVDVPINKTFGEEVWGYSNGKFVDGIGTTTNTLPYDLTINGCNMTDVAISIWCYDGIKEINGIGTGEEDTSVNSTYGKYVWEWINSWKYINGISG